MKSGFHRFTGKVFQAAVEVLTKTGHACADHCDLSHTGLLIYA
jgi:hypothetical protein